MCIRDRSQSVRPVFLELFENDLLGVFLELGAAFGLDNDWSLRIIKQVGNYGESYKRNIADTGILPDRGPNELWTKGGILYVPPAR